MSRLNMHGDHVASCWCCKFLGVHRGFPGTDVTPADPEYNLFCEAPEFEDGMGDLNWDLETMHLLTVHGSTCKQFEARDEPLAEPGSWWKD